MVPPSRPRLAIPTGFAVLETWEDDPPPGHRWFYPICLARTAAGGYRAPSYFPASPMARRHCPIRRFNQRGRAVHFLLDQRDQSDPARVADDARRVAHVH